MEEKEKEEKKEDEDEDGGEGLKREGGEVENIKIRVPTN